jgi:hypothetical protein
MAWLTRVLARDTSLWSDDVWVADSTLVECGRSRETARRTDLAGRAQYGYCASHSRWFWGLRLRLITTLYGLPVRVALTGAKAHERAGPAEHHGRPGPQRRAGRRSSSPARTTTAATEAALAEGGFCLLRPAWDAVLKPLRQVIESVNATFKTRLDLERHGGHTPLRRLNRSPAARPGPDRRDLAQRPAMVSLPLDSWKSSPRPLRGRVRWLLRRAAAPARAGGWDRRFSDLPPENRSPKRCQG